MKLLILSFLIVFSQHIVAQQGLELSKVGSDKVVLFKENKRVKVKTLEGEKYIGRFQIVDDQNINIEGNIISLSDIKNIKSRSVIAGVGGTVLIIYGAVVMVVGIIVELSFGTTPEILFIAGFGAVIMTSGILFNEFAKNHKQNKWFYKIINS